MYLLHTIMYNLIAAHRENCVSTNMSHLLLFILQVSTFFNNTVIVKECNCSNM